MLTSSPESNVQKQCFRTKMCSFFVDGKCSKGNYCSFAHDQEELQAKPNFKKTRICSAFAQRKCAKTSEQCSFAHGDDDLRRSSRNQNSAGVNPTTRKRAQNILQQNKGHDPHANQFTPISSISSNIYPPASMPVMGHHRHHHHTVLPVSRMEHGLEVIAGAPKMSYEDELSMGQLAPFSQEYQTWVASGELEHMEHSNSPVRNRPPANSLHMIYPNVEHSPSSNVQSCYGSPMTPEPANDLSKVVHAFGKSGVMPGHISGDMHHWIQPEFPMYAKLSESEDVEPGMRHVPMSQSIRMPDPYLDGRSNSGYIGPSAQTLFAVDEARSSLAYETLPPYLSGAFDPHFNPNVHHPISLARHEARPRVNSALISPFVTHDDSSLMGPYISSQHGDDC